MSEMIFECEECGSDLIADIQEDTDNKTTEVKVHCARNLSHNVTPKMKEAVLNIMRRDNLI